MNKREFLKAGGAGIVAATLARPAQAARPGRRIAIVQTHLPGADAFAARERAAGAELMAPSGDPVRWFRQTLRPVLGRADVAGFTDAAHSLVLEGSLREAGYVRSGKPAHAGRAILWGAVKRV